MSIEPAAASFMGCGRGWPEREKDRWSDQSRIISSGWSDLHTHRKVFYAGARCEQAKSVGLRVSPGVIAGQSWSYLAVVGAYWKSLVPRTYMRGFSYNPLEQLPPAIQRPTTCVRRFYIGIRHHLDEGPIFASNGPNVESRWRAIVHRTAYDSPNIHVGVKIA